MVNEMRENVVKNKSFAFAVRVVKLYQFLCEQKKEFILSKQMLRGGTNETTLNQPLKLNLF